MKLFICLVYVFAVTQAKLNCTRYEPKNIYKPIREINLPNNRIVGGYKAKPNQFPWQVALLIETSKKGCFFCGGSLISENWVLTAAQCVEGANSVEAIMGAHRYKNNESTQVRMISNNFITHEKYSSQFNRIKNDIALVQLPEAVTLTKNIQLVTLPTRRDARFSFVGTMATITGWGKESDLTHNGVEVLKFVETRIIECSIIYSEDDGRFINTNMCVNETEGKGPCNGDTGGPLVIITGHAPLIKKKQLGIVSVIDKFYGCQPGHALFTKVSSYLDWIQEKTNIVIS